MYIRTYTICESILKIEIVIIPHIILICIYFIKNRSNVVRLFVAEKPSLARAIAEGLPKPLTKGNGFVQASNGDIITWCVGHLLELVPPEYYDEKYKKWNIEHLPIIPQNWKLKPKESTFSQLNIIKGLIKKADILVNCGDNDREGQLLIDEVFNYCNASKEQMDNALRCLVSDMNLEPVKKAIANLRSNKEFLPLSISALARSRADWLYGMNLTRASTIQGQKSGYRGVLSIGRVQTPVLGLIVNRDLEIKNFVSKPFYEIEANIESNDHVKYVGKWKPSDKYQDYMDDEGRILSKDVLTKLINQIINATGTIIKSETIKKQQGSPLLFSLSALQIAASKAYNMNAKQVLDICQKLYETHKLVTYPRSDCQYLPKEHLNDVNKVIKAISVVSDQIKPMISNADLKLVSKAWNDSKVGAHHAIIPTAKSSLSIELTKEEQKIYDLIAKQYLAQFYPPFEFTDKEIHTKIESELFISKQKDIINSGWKDLFKSSKAADDGEDFGKVNLPNLTKGDDVTCLSGSLLSKNTTPPKHFNDASLLSALIGIARFVEDPQIKKSLRETDGLGTEATRANIIDLLFKREFLVKKGKDIYATDTGMKLITSLPTKISKPDMTALWESQLNSIVSKTISYNNFMDGIINGVSELVGKVKDISFSNLPQQKIPVSQKMKDLVSALAKSKNIQIPSGTLTDYAKAKSFIEANYVKRDPLKIYAPSDKQLKLADKIIETVKNLKIPEDLRTNSNICREFIETYLSKMPTQPPSPAQIKFAQDLINNLQEGEKTPKNVLTDVSVCKKFIDNQLNKKKKQVKAKKAKK